MQERDQMWRTIRRLITVVAILAGIFLFVVRPIEKITRHTENALKTTLSRALGTVTGRETIIREGRAELSGSSEIAELAILELRMSATRAIEKSESFSMVPLGTKKLVVRGSFRVKAGYRLEPGVSLRQEHGTTVARFPAPRILSVEMLDFDTLTEESGWLNRIQPEDRAQILRELREQMAADAMASGLPDLADGTLRTRLRDLLGTENVILERPLP